MALDNYFKALKLNTGVCELTLVEDRAVRRRITCSLLPKQDNPQDRLRNSLRTCASKFTMDDCDEPLFKPTRQMSSSTDLSDQSSSIDSMLAFGSSQSIGDDSVNKSCGSDPVVSADSRWSSSSFCKKNPNYPIQLGSPGRTPNARSITMNLLREAQCIMKDEIYNPAREAS